MKWFRLIYGFFNMYVASCHVVSSKVMKSHESDKFGTKFEIFWNLVAVLENIATKNCKKPHIWLQYWKYSNRGVQPRVSNVHIMPTITTKFDRCMILSEANDEFCSNSEAIERLWENYGLRNFSAKSIRKTFFIWWHIQVTEIWVHFRSI